MWLINVPKSPENCQTTEPKDRIRPLLFFFFFEYLVLFYFYYFIEIQNVIECLKHVNINIKCESCCNKR